MSQPENSPHPDDRPLVDHAALDPILSATGAAVMRGIIDAFWNAADGMMAAIESAVASGDKTALVRAAHTLKGAAANIGAGRAAALAGRLEKLEPGETGPAMEQLRQAMQDTRPALYEAVQDAA